MLRITLDTCERRRKASHAPGCVFLENQELVLHPSGRECFRIKRGGAVWLAVDRKAEAGPEGVAGGHAPLPRGTLSAPSGRPLLSRRAGGAPSGRPFTKRRTKRSGDRGHPPRTYGPRLFRPRPCLAHLDGLEAEKFSRGWDAFGRSKSQRLGSIVVWFRARRYGGARWTCRTHRPARNRAVLFAECSQLDLLSLTFAILYPLSGRSGNFPR